MLKKGILKKSIEEAENSDHPIYKIGAVVFKGSRIFGSGHNSYRSSSIPMKYKRFSHTLHAEQAAIKNTTNWEDLRGSSIIVIRINKSGNISKSYPCEYCMRTILFVGIKKLYFFDRKGKMIIRRIK